MSATLPADAEGELRDLARDLRSNGAPFEADRLERLINQYSGLRPMREGEAPRVIEYRGVVEEVHRTRWFSQFLCRFEELRPYRYVEISFPFDFVDMTGYGVTITIADDGKPRTAEGAAEIALLGIDHPKRTP